MGTVVDTAPPELTVPPQQTIEWESAGAVGEPFDLRSLVSFSDLCDTAPVLTLEPDLLVYPLGDTLVTVTVTDASDNSTSDTVTISVVDTTAPELTVPPQQTIEWESEGAVGEPFDLLSLVSISDLGDAAPVLTLEPDLLVYPLGDTLVTVTVTDASDNSTSD